MKVLFSADEYMVRQLQDEDLDSTLEVYRQCEDFLSLGPVAKASREMVACDIVHSRKTRGTYCGIWDDSGTQVGILDFVPKAGNGSAFLSLLMISIPHRGRHIGTAIVAALESYLRAKYGTRKLESGVQVNNPVGIAFWKKCGFQVDSHPRPQKDGTTTFSMYKIIPK